MLSTRTAARLACHLVRSCCEDRSNKLLDKVGDYVSLGTVSCIIPEDLNLLQHCCEDPKSFMNI